MKKVSGKAAVRKNPQPLEKPIYVTSPFLPPLNEFIEGLQEIWDNKWLTNNGPILQRFRGELALRFETDNLCLFANGTLALQIALKGMEISGEVITTPFTFVATTHALHLNQIRPVFVDIEPNYYTLDPEKVEAAINPSTTAILAVHVFGHPSSLNELADIASRHDLKLIYDAAHAFGVKVDGIPITDFGNLSMISFHATKLFHSFEGGMLTFSDSSLRETFDHLKNFGIKNEVETIIPGTNAKMNEVQALMGSIMLKYIDRIIEKLKQISDVYRRMLKNIPGIHLTPELPMNVSYNYAYIPIEVDEKEFGLSRDELYQRLKDFNIYSRRYFYPLVPDLASYQDIAVTDPLTVAHRVASRILVLPIYFDLNLEDVERICDIVALLSKNSQLP